MNDTDWMLDTVTMPNRDWSLEQWLYYLEHRHQQAIQLRLVNPAQVATSLNLVAWSIPVITVAGTNGKGSTVAALSAIYQAAGYQVGRFTSPHLFRFNERIAINQKPISDDQLCDIFFRIELARGQIALTYFEMSLLAALLYFKEADLDLLILEVGVGGRLDATNIIDANLAIVTTVDLDHQDLLGPDKEAIGKEKAGIFRQGQPCIYADYSPPASVLAYAHQVQAKLLCLGLDYQFRIEDQHLHIQHAMDCRSLILPLPAIHPHAAVSAVIATLCLKLRLPVSEQDWVTGMRTVGIEGRQQWLPGDISLLCDVAHNPQAATALRHTIEKKLAAAQAVAPKTIHAVFSALKDKDICGLIKPLSPIVDQWHLAPLSGQRAADSDQLQLAFQDATGLQAQCYADPIQAIQAAIAHSKAGDWIVVYGSFLLVSAVMTAYKQGMIDG